MQKISAHAGGGSFFSSQDAQIFLLESYMDFNEIKTNMEFLGTYKKEFDNAIYMFLDIQKQYEKAWKEFEKGGMKSTVECAGGVKKNPILVTIEDLRKQYVTYSDRLGLNPKALDQIKNAQITKENTVLENFLMNFNGKTDDSD